MIEKLRDVFGADPRSGLEFALLLAKYQLPVGVEHREARNTLFQRHFIFLGEVQILIVVTDVDVHHVIIRVHQRRNRLGVECSVQNVAVVAPITAENQDYPLVVSGRRGQRRADLGSGFLWIGV